MTNDSLLDAVEDRINTFENQLWAEVKRQLDQGPVYDD